MRLLTPGPKFRTVLKGFIRRSYGLSSSLYASRSSYSIIYLYAVFEHLVHKALLLQQAR